MSERMFPDCSALAYNQVTSLQRPLQEVSESRNDDRRHRTHALDQKRSIQTRQASRQKQNRFRDLECSARRVTSADFQASDCSAYNVCTTTPAAMVITFFKAFSC